jgi:hypothetical protein
MPGELVGRVTSVDSNGSILIDAPDIGKWPVGTQLVVVDESGQRVATIKVTDVIGRHITAQYFGTAKYTAAKIREYVSDEESGSWKGATAGAATGAAAVLLSPFLFPFLPAGIIAATRAYARHKRNVLSQIKQGMLVYELPAGEIPNYSPDRYESAVEKYRPHSA